MAYKILYLEDLNPETKVAELRSYGYDVDAYKPSSLEETLSKISIGEYDALIFDYKLTANREKNANKLYNAPTVAQTLRSTGFNVPIILVSSQKVITESFNADYTSQDLFDFCVSKESSAVLVIRCAISRSSDTEKSQNREKQGKRLA